jgi:hypothetical protein
VSLNVEIMSGSSSRFTAAARLELFEVGYFKPGLEDIPFCTYAVAVSAWECTFRFLLPSLKGVPGKLTRLKTLCPKLFLLADRHSLG